MRLHGVQPILLQLLPGASLSWFTEHRKCMGWRVTIWRKRNVRNFLYKVLITKTKTGIIPCNGKRGRSSRPVGYSFSVPKQWFIAGYWGLLSADFFSKMKSFTFPGFLQAGAFHMKYCLDSLCIFSLFFYYSVPSISTMTNRLPFSELSSLLMLQEQYKTLDTFLDLYHRGKRSSQWSKR